MNFPVHQRCAFGQGIPLPIELLETRRLLSSGSLDQTCGNGGIVRGPAGSNSDMVIQPDRKILVSIGSALLRYNQNGTVDTSFSGDGRVDATAWALGLQSDGKIIV